MPELLTQPKTPEIPDRWPELNRNDGRLQIGMVADITSEYPAGFNRNPHAVATLRQFEDVPDHLLTYLSPLDWEHVNLTGDYVWRGPQGVSENTDGLRPLRAIPDLVRKAA